MFQEPPSLKKSINHTPHTTNMKAYFSPLFPCFRVLFEAWIKVGNTLKHAQKVSVCRKPQNFIVPMQN
jgi:hypothetical protein